MRLLVSAVAAAALFVVAVPAPARSRTCGTVTASGSRYRIVVEQGAIPCAAALPAIRSYLVTFKRPRGWACFLGHDGDRWAAACSPVSGRWRGSIVRAYRA
jgi:hypothetical protein